MGNGFLGTEMLKNVGSSMVPTVCRPLPCQGDGLPPLTSGMDMRLPLTHEMRRCFRNYMASRSFFSLFSKQTHSQGGQLFWSCPRVKRSEHTASAGEQLQQVCSESSQQASAVISLRDFELICYQGGFKQNVADLSKM